MQRARDTRHEVHVLEVDRRGFDALEAHLRSAHEALCSAFGVIAVQPVPVTCGANFRSLADGSWRVCTLPPEHACAHAWGDR